MESTDLGKIVNAEPKLRVRKRYVAPQLQRLSPVALKALLTRDAAASDTQLQQMIESDDELHGAKGS